MRDIKELSEEELKSILKGWGEADFSARQIFSWIYKKGALDFEVMSNLSIALRQRLKSDFYILDLKAVKELESYDQTKKILFALRDESLIEAVFIPAESWATGCISTQVGCPFACRFCASGALGFRRNLTSGEIISEVLYLKNMPKSQQLTHIVFMGTGEPLDNYDNLIKAIKIINSPYRLNIGARRITISTSGIIPGIKRLTEEGLQIELAVSLHSADNKVRSKIMPINKKYPLEELISACKEYSDKTNRQVTFEYILISGLNSGLQDAQKLATILKGLRLSKVNLIPANPIKELNIAPPSKLDMLLFKNCLLKSGINVTLRKSRGQDIDAACGQLRLGYESI